MLVVWFRSSTKVPSNHFLTIFTYSLIGISEVKERKKVNVLLSLPTLLSVELSDFIVFSSLVKESKMHYLLVGNRLVSFYFSEGVAHSKEEFNHRLICDKCSC